MALLLIKAGTRVEAAIIPGVWVPGVLQSIEFGGSVGFVRLDSTGRSFLFPANEIVPRWPWTGGE